jgi:hypothetical protein
MKVLDYLRIIFRYASLPVFTISIKNGITTLSQGKAPDKLVSEFSTIARNQNISRGIIYGVRDDKRITLDFSSSISDGDRQRFRNVLNLYGH